jgi:hypothetical protein
LAQAYYYGQGVTQNPKEAVRWFQRAADQGDAPSEYALSVLYDRGIAVDRDPRKSAYWLDRATQHGYTRPPETIASESRGGGE